MPSNTIQYKTDGAYYNNNKLLTTADSVSVTDTNATTSGIVNLTDQKLGAGEKTVDKLIVNPGVANTTGIKVPQVTNPHITSTTYQNITVSTKILIPDANGNLIPATFTPGGGTTLTIGELVAKGYMSLFSTLNFLNFVTESVGSVVSITSQLGTGAVNSDVNSYTAGYSPVSNVIKKFMFSSETLGIFSGTLATSRLEGLGNVNSTTRGYFAGGQNGSLVPSSEIDGIDFIIDTSINPSSTLAVSRGTMASANSTTRGYFAGGTTYWSMQSEIDGIDFSTESSINPAASLVAARFALAGTNSTTKGYFAGGTNSGWVGVTEIDGINFSTEASINPTATLSVDKHWVIGNNSLSDGYYSGGLNTGDTVTYNTIEKINFSTEAIGLLGATLTTPGSGTCGFQSGGIL